MIAIRVREFIRLLQELNDQDAYLVIGEGRRPELWLPVTGLVECRIAPPDDSPDCVGPGPEHAFEIV